MKRVIIILLMVGAFFSLVGLLVVSYGVKSESYDAMAKAREAKAKKKAQAEKEENKEIEVLTSELNDLENGVEA